MMSSGVAVHLSQVNRRWGCGKKTGAPPVQTAVSPLRAVSESGGTNERRSDRLRKKGEAHEESEKADDPALERYAWRFSGRTDRRTAGGRRVAVVGLCQ